MHANHYYKADYASNGGYYDSPEVYGDVGVQEIVKAYQGKDSYYAVDYEDEHSLNNPEYQVDYENNNN